MVHSSGQPTILVVDDDAAVSWALQEALSSAGYQVMIAADAQVAQRLLRRQVPDLIITDIRMPGLSGLELLALIKLSHPHLPIVVSTAHGTMETAIEAVRGGAFDYLPKPLDLDRTLDVVRRTLGEDPLAAAATPSTPATTQVLVGSSAVMQELFRRIAAAAATDLEVLITGASGTGKGLVAEALHRHGRRHQKPFIVVACDAIPEPQIEALLFAEDGRLAAATGGILFLDEVAELPVPAQVRLLQYLESRPAGEPAVRVIAATNRDLPKLIAGGDFREDLAYRLKAISLQLPPLSARLDDLATLVRHFLGQMARRLGRQVALTDEAMAALHRHRWPGNVRELRHVIEEAAALATGGVIAVDHLDLPAPDDAGDPAPTGFRVATAAMTNHLLRTHPGDVHAQLMDAVEDVLLRTVLAQTEGNQLRAAEILGINRITLKKRMDHLKISRSGGES